MRTIFKRLSAVLGKTKPDKVDVENVGAPVYQGVHDQIFKSANLLLSEAMGQAVKLALVRTERAAWGRVVPESTPSECDLLEAPNLGSVILYDAVDPGAALAYWKASSPFKKTRICLRSRKMKRLRNADWLDQGFYEYAFYRHVLICVTKSRRIFEVAVVVGDGETLLPDLDCRDLIFEWVSSVGKAVESNPVAPPNHSIERMVD